MINEVEHRPHCGICQVPVTDFKAHMESEEHWKKVEEVSKDPEAGLIMQSMALNLLLKRSQKNMKESFDKLREGIEDSEYKGLGL